jgi:hypothetical protein
MFYVCRNEEIVRQSTISPLSAPTPQGTLESAMNAAFRIDIGRERGVKFSLTGLAAARDNLGPAILLT